MCSILKMESHPRHILLTKPYTNRELHGRHPVISVCPHSIYYINLQASHHAGMQKFSLLQLVTVVVVSATVEEFSMMDPPFTVIYHDLLLSAMSTMQSCHRAETWCVQEAMFSYANHFSRYVYAYNDSQYFL